MQTKLKISQAGFPPMSMGNCRQIISSLVKGDVWRTINGDAVLPEMGREHKYKTNIYGQDVNSPCFDGISVGSIVGIDCIQQMWGNSPAESTGAIILKRKPVEGSVIAVDKNRTFYDLEQIGEKEFILKDGPVSEDICIGYLPHLDVIITHLTVNHEEWGNGYKWELEAEEV